MKNKAKQKPKMRNEKQSEKRKLGKNQKWKATITYNFEIENQNGYWEIPFPIFSFFNFWKP
jgi:hypothetical protein